MRKLFLILCLLSTPALADQCDTGLLRCIAYAPDRQGECYALAAQCKQQAQVVGQLQQMNRTAPEPDTMAGINEKYERMRRR